MRRIHLLLLPAIVAPALAAFDIGDYTAQAGTNAHFQVNVGASLKPTFAWFRNGQAVSGATASIWRPLVTAADDGAQVYCRVTYEFLGQKTANTNTARLTVLSGPVPVAWVAPASGTAIALTTPQPTTLVMRATGVDLTWSAAYADGRTAPDLSGYYRQQWASIVLPATSPVPASITVRARTPAGTQVSATFPLAFAPAPPVVARHELGPIHAGGSLALAAPGLLRGAVDPNGDTLVASLAGAPQPYPSYPALPDSGQATVAADGAFTYHLDLVDVPTETRVLVPYRATDATGRSTDGEVSIAISANRLPLPAEDAVVLPEPPPAEVAIDVLANDIDPDAGDTLRVTAVGTPQAGRIRRDGDRLWYAPTSPVAIDRFWYAVDDGKAPAREVPVRVYRPGVTATGGPDADADGDGDIDTADLDAVVRAFGTTAAEPRP